MTSSRTSAGAAALLLCAASFGGASARPLSAQDANRAAHERVAGCYAIEPTEETPWLRQVEQKIRLTLDPVPETPGVTDPSGSPQFVVRPVAGDARTEPLRWTYLAWSLFGDGDIVSIVWSSEREQVALTFAPEPMKPRAVSIGSTTWFQHEKMTTTEPVDVRVTAILC